MADVPLGVFLSGGLDSGSIVAFMHDLGVAPIRTFTIGFAEQGFSEVELARQVAARYGTEHHELVVRPDASTLLPTSFVTSTSRSRTPRRCPSGTCRASRAST
jgi:asparagine synthase (glutamine-hydrolysing)